MLDHTINDRAYIIDNNVPDQLSAQIDQINQI